MMEYLLIKLARFIKPFEQSVLVNDIEKAINPFTNFLEIQNDEWGEKNRLLAKFELKEKNPEFIINKILDIPGIVSIIHIPLEFFNWEFSSFSSLIEQLTYFLTVKENLDSYMLDFRLFGKIPFHKKAIIDRLRKKKLNYKSDTNFLLYLEVKQKNNILNQTIKVFEARIGRKTLPEVFNQNWQYSVKPQLVLYSPFTKQEVADFLRLSLLFNTTIFFTNENNRVPNLIEDVQKNFFKGITKVKYTIVPTLDALITKFPKEFFFGFSLWGKNSVIELPSLLNKFIQNNTKETKPLDFFFVFGNEENGLPLSIRYQIPMFRIGAYVSEPLRASQAAAYALGIISFLLEKSKE